MRQHITTYCNPRSIIFEVVNHVTAFLLHIASFSGGLELTPSPTRVVIEEEGGDTRPLILVMCTMPCAVMVCKHGHSYVECVFCVQAMCAGFVCSLCVHRLVGQTSTRFVVCVCCLLVLCARSVCRLCAHRLVAQDNSMQMITY
jgi:hypothetical protein